MLEVGAKTVRIARLQQRVFDHGAVVIDEHSSPHRDAIRRKRLTRLILIAIGNA
jgi:hypothetical protein